MQKANEPPAELLKLNEYGPSDPVPELHYTHEDLEQALKTLGIWENAELEMLSGGRINNALKFARLQFEIRWLRQRVDFITIMLRKQEQEKKSDGNSS